MWAPAQILVIRALKIKREAYWDFFDAGNLKSKIFIIYSFQLVG